MLKKSNENSMIEKYESKFTRFMFLITMESIIIIFIWFINSIENNVVTSIILVLMVIFSIYTIVKLILAKPKIELRITNEYIEFYIRKKQKIYLKDILEVKNGTIQRGVHIKYSENGKIKEYVYTPFLKDVDYEIQGIICELNERIAILNTKN